jgi:hypothetical protein
MAKMRMQKNLNFRIDYPNGSKIELIVVEKTNDCNSLIFEL